MRRSKRKADLNTTASAAAVSAVATISDVPNHIVCDILSRLPLNSIFTCKRVSKAWHHLILDPHFSTLHLSRSPPSLIFYRNGGNNDNQTEPNQVMCPNGNNGNNCSSSHFEIFQLHDPPVLEHNNATMKFKTEIDIPMDIAASCNGLILLSNRWHSFDDLIVVCNPLRAQHFVLPNPPKSCRRNSGFGFGHSPATDQYKVLRFTFRAHSPSKLDFHICTFGIDKKWRSIGYDAQPPAVFTSQLVFLNGALHWIGVENENSWFICYFDIAKEEFGSFPLPSHIGNALPYLGIVDNCLYIQEDYAFNEQKLWVMKDYGDFWSWTLECVIDEPRLGTAKLLKMLEDGTLLMMFNKCSEEGSIKITLASYNRQTTGLRKIKHHGDLLWGASVADVPRFLSPFDALK